MSASSSSDNAPSSYPSTPYLEISPGGDRSDSVVSDTNATRELLEWCSDEIVVTEKLDGGNCCIWDGRVYARTLSSPTSKPWFSPVKALTPEISRGLRDAMGESDASDLQLFGENMTAVHGIQYSALDSHLYLFAVRRASSSMWLPWDDVLKLAGMCNLPTVPVLFRGQVSSPAALRGILEEASRRPSALCVTCPPEGFVVRLAGSFRNRDFANCVSKYVLKDFQQVQNFSSKTWKKANVTGSSRVLDLCHQAACRQGPCSPLSNDIHPINKNDDDETLRCSGTVTATLASDEGEVGSEVLDHGSLQARPDTSPCRLLPMLPEPGMPLSNLVRQMRGPTCNSNWVIPGMVMAGNRSSVDKHPHELIAEGITTFVSLQQKQDTPGRSYQKRVLQAFPEARFRSFPIPDQNIAQDSHVNAFVQELVQRVLENGEVLYIHCTGGHGRTGTICALLLASAYKLGAEESIGRVQAYHDTRQTPVFRAPYRILRDRVTQEPRCWSLPEADDCVALFPIQRQQVQHIVGRGLLNYFQNDASDDSGVLDEPDEKGGEENALSTESSDSTERDQAWVEIGKQAMMAASMRDWEAAAKLLRRCIDLRPNWPKSYTLLARCMEKLGRKSDAAWICAHGTRICRDSHAAQGTSRHYQVLKDLAHTLASSLPSSSSRGGVVVNDCKAPACFSISGNEGREIHAKATDARSYSCPDTADTSSGSSSAGMLLTSPLRKELLPSFVMLVGLPGAGKSTFAEALQRSNPKEWQLLSSDAIGPRSAVEEALSNAMRPHKTGKSAPQSRRVILDRCNVTVDERRQMLAVAFEPSNAVAVYFKSASIETCVSRVAARTDHPSIGYGRGRYAVKSMYQVLTPPSTAEGFSKVISLSTFDDVATLLHDWGAAAPCVPPPGFFKFPRTRHLMNTGGSSVTRDDMVMDAGEAAAFWAPGAVVIAEEKIDGANLGLSLTKSFEIRVQNRSHYVNAESHGQFRSLDAWLDEHHGTLCQILEPEVEILFGEWMYAVHSLTYDRLPGYFIAFDIYNKREAKFCSVRIRDQRLQGSGIPVVQAIAQREFKSRDALLDIINSSSKYMSNGGKMEGSYLRIDDEHWNIKRGKIVRSDFQQGIADGGKHWSSGMLRRNRLLHA